MTPKSPPAKRNTSAPTSPTPSKKTLKSSSENSFDYLKSQDLENDLLERILQVSLSRQKTPLVYLESLGQDEGSRGLKNTMLDRIFVERLSLENTSLSSNLIYLLECYVRLEEEKMSIQKIKLKDQLIDTLFAKLNDLIISYAGLLFLYPDALNQSLSL